MLMTKSPGAANHIEGFFLGSKEVDSKFSEKKSVIHLFQNYDGTILGVWGGSSLNQQLRSVPKGYVTRISNNCLAIKNGKKFIKEYLVEYDKDNFIPNKIYINPKGKLKTINGLKLVPKSWFFVGIL